MSMNQKSGVWSCVCDAFGQTSFDGPVQLSELEKSTILNQLATMFLDGDIEMTEAARTKYHTHDLMVGYCKGLLNNWIRKDIRLNGGTKYEAKNPGSRAGSGDTMLRELKKLRVKVGSDADAVSKVDEAIAERQAELVKPVEINEEHIPEGLKHLLKN